VQDGVHFVLYSKHSSRTELVEALKVTTDITAASDGQLGVPLQDGQWLSCCVRLCWMLALPHTFPSNVLAIHALSGQQVACGPWLAAAGGLFSEVELLLAQQAASCVGTTSST
jgi:hypothetical protein